LKNGRLFFCHSIDLNSNESIMKAKPIILAMGMLMAVPAWAEAPKDNAAVPAAASAPEAAAPAAEPSAVDASIRKMDANLDKMHQVLAQMKQAKDPAERQKLMGEYLNAQHDNMQLSHAYLGWTGPSPMGPRMGAMSMQRGMPGAGMNRAAPCLQSGPAAGMGPMGMQGMDMKGMGKGMGMKRMGMMKMMEDMGSKPDEGLMARIHDIDKRLDALQDMMNMMMRH
jgi:hypothetical protein